jgi:hypothetical protein
MSAVENFKLLIEAKIYWEPLIDFLNQVECDTWKYI